MNIIYNEDKLLKDLKQEWDKWGEGKINRHKYEVLEQINHCKKFLIQTLEVAYTYVQDIGIIPCGAIHECNKKGFPNECCTYKRKSAGCLHQFDFERKGHSAYTLAVGYNIFGIKFFTIAYFLFQKGYDLEWHLSEKDFAYYSRQSQIYDREIRDYYKDPEMLELDPGIVNKKSLKEYKIKMGEHLIKKYVEPVKDALDDYMKRVGCILE